MAKSGVGDRLAWKDRIDQSPWVDSTHWLNDEQGSANERDGEQPIEFVEAEPSAYRLSEVPGERPQTASTGPSTRILALVAVAVVLIALAIMSRPGDRDPLDQLPPDQQQVIRQRQDGVDSAIARELGPADDVGSSAVPQPIPSAAGEAAGEAGPGEDPAAGPPALRPIPPLREDLPTDLPGVLVGYGADGSLLQIDWTAAAVVEDPLDPAPRPDDRGLTATESMATFDGAVYVHGYGRLHRLRLDGPIDRPAIPIGSLFPSDAGFVVETRPDRIREVYLVSVDEGGALTPSVPWAVSDDLRLIGAWRGNLLVAKTGTVWLVDRAGGSTLVTSGEVLAFDGDRLAVVRCYRPDDCRIELGPPNQPAERSVPVPETLRDRPIESWTASGAITADGRRLALTSFRAAVTLPIWVDMETGQDETLAESANPETPLAWSPDGEYLAFGFDDDIMILRTVDKRSWRVIVDRQIGQLAWLETADQAAE